MNKKRFKSSKNGRKIAERHVDHGIEYIMRKICIKNRDGLYLFF